MSDFASVMGLGVLCTVLIVLLVNAWTEAGRHDAADMKYRFLRLSGGFGTLRALDNADSLYVNDPGRLGKWVEDQERVRREEAERLRQLQVAKEKVKQLEKAAK